MASFRYSPLLTRAALAPTIALESTIVSHGMPYPQNLHTAQSVESIITKHGCIPATIAVKNGVPQIGLSPGDLKDLARAGPENRATKYTTRELGYALSVKPTTPATWGSTTVASTMHFAHRAGIDMFVTGGSGGVHRDYADSLDVSADLTELARTPVTVISAGIKSILDIPRTLEFLETHAVTVGVLGSDEFPAFFSPNSGVKSPLVFDSYSSVAECIVNNRAIGLPGGFLLACPNPSPLPGVDDAVAQALAELAEQNIVGKQVTPFLLKRVAELTDGGSLASNIALVENNATVGANGTCQFPLAHSIL